MSVHHSELFYKTLDACYLGDNKKKPWTKEELNKVAADIALAKRIPGKKTRRQYHLLSLYNLLEVGGQTVVTKQKTKNEGNYIRVVAYEDLFDILYETHINVGHGGRDKMMYALKAKYDIGRYAIEKFIDTCEVCQKKKNKSHANLIIKPIISIDFNSRGQVDLIDFQSCPDNDFNWLLNYQDHLTKFLFLRPLKTKTASEVAKELLKIFLEIGAPAILQSDNGREFTASIISEMVKIWPSLKILHGHPQSQGCVERSNQDVERMLTDWMYDQQSTSWSLGCYFVQFKKNCSFHKVIGRTPYKALFGVDPKVGFEAKNIPRDLLGPIENEEDLHTLLKESAVDIVTEKEAIMEAGNGGSIESKEEGNIQAANECNIEEGNRTENEANIETVFEPEVNIIIDEFNNINENESITENRHEAGRGQKRTAEKMLSKTIKK